MTVLVATVVVIVDVVDAATVLVATGSGNFDEQKDSAGGKPERSDAIIEKTPVHGDAAETKQGAKITEV